MSKLKRVYRPGLNLSSIKEEDYQKTNMSKMYNRIAHNNIIIPPISYQIKSVLNKTKSQSCENIKPSSHLIIETLNPLYLPSLHSSQKSNRDILCNKETQVTYMTDNLRCLKSNQNHKKELTLIYPNKPIMDKGLVDKYANLIIKSKKRKKLSPLKLSQYLNNKVTFIPGAFNIIKNNSVSSYRAKSKLKQIDLGKFIWLNKGKYEYLLNNVVIK